MALKIYVKEYQKLDGNIVKEIERVGDGSIIKRFDLTPIPNQKSNVVCPHFLELKWATGCPFNCAWCYLQGTFRFQEYKKNPRCKGYDRLEKHMLSLFNGDTVNQSEILNAGELSDALIMEGTDDPFTTRVMDLISQQNTYKVLFQTKSNRIDNLIKVPNPEQCVVGFSVNAPAVAKRWEKGAPAVEERLNAARKLKEAGFEVRLRIDPMVPIRTWRSEYGKLMDIIFSSLSPDRITIGSLRGLQSTINNSKDRSWTEFLDENSNWGKKIGSDKRYEMYKFIFDRLEEKGYDTKNVGLCKETVEMWDKLGRDYREIKCNCLI